MATPAPSFTTTSSSSLRAVGQLTPTTTTTTNPSTRINTPTTSTPHLPAPTPTPTPTPTSTSTSTSTPTTFEFPPDYHFPPLLHAPTQPQHPRNSTRKMVLPDPLLLRAPPPLPPRLDGRAVPQQAPEPASRARRRPRGLRVHASRRAGRVRSVEQRRWE